MLLRLPYKTFLKNIDRQIIALHSMYFDDAILNSSDVE
jgi:hypothetical protein